MVKPIIPYIGGKQKLAKKILTYFPKHTCYVEPFAGGLAMLFAKEQSKCEVVNDISNDLICFYRVIQNHYQEFIKQFDMTVSSRKQFQDLANQDSELLTDIQKAARFFYLQKLCFGGATHSRKFGTSTTSNPRLNTDSLSTKLSEVHGRLKKVSIENLDWSTVIEKYDRPHTLFYCDPPYWKTAGYGTPFAWHEYEKLASYMNTIKGKMIVSINDHPDIRKLFNGFKKIPLQTTYTCGKQKSKAKELLILNKATSRALKSP